MPSLRGHEYSRGAPSKNSFEVTREVEKVLARAPSFAKLDRSGFDGAARRPNDGLGCALYPVAGAGAGRPGRRHRVLSEESASALARGACHSPARG
jgi:hypothetical protein